MVSAIVCVAGWNQCHADVLAGLHDLALQMSHVVDQIWHGRCWSQWCGNALLGTQQLSGERQMSWQWSWLGSRDSHGIKDIVILDSFLLPFYWDWVCTVEEWSNSSLSFTHLLPWVTIAKRQIFVAQQSHWTRTTQASIFLSLEQLTVLNSHKHILVTMVFIHFKKMDIQGGAFLFPWVYITAEKAHRTEGNFPLFSYCQSLDPVTWFKFSNIIVTYKMRLNGDKKPTKNSTATDLTAISTLFTWGPLNCFETVFDRNSVCMAKLEPGHYERLHGSKNPYG